MIVDVCIRIFDDPRLQVQTRGGCDVKVDFSIEQQIDNMISDYTKFVEIIKGIGDPAGSSELMNAKLKEVRQLKQYRGGDLYKIPIILESFLNESGYESPSDKVSLQVTDVTNNRLYIEVRPINLRIHALYSLTGDRVLLEVAAYGEDKYGVWGGMYLIGSRMFPFRSAKGR